MNKIFSFYCLLFFGVAFLPATAQSQQPRKHFVYFTDKANSPYSLIRPEGFLSQKALARRNRQRIKLTNRDLPVNPAYVTGIKNLGVQVVYKSKWFNGAVVFCDSVQLQQVLNLSYVKDQSIILNREQPSTSQPDKFEKEITNQNRRLTADRSTYGKSFHQADMIGATYMHDAGFHGEGMTIAVFDAGFPGVDTATPFAHLYQNNQIKGVYDFVGNDTNIYERSSHGTQTLSCIGAYEPGKYIGTGYKSDFYLFITEDERTEQQIEEINWLVAAEYADSAGVDIISSSLGYTTFDYPSFSYSQSDLDGNTTLSTKAADFAAATGILVVNSAGNEGNSSWRSLGAPSDGDSVMAVAAVDSAGRKASFSSFGYLTGQKVKPNLAAQGFLAAVVFPNGNIGLNNGTSFSCPILAGMTAGFWQAHPFLTNIEVIQYLQRSATLANNPNDGLGYGIPNFAVGRIIVNQDFGTGNEVMLFPNPTTTGEVNIRFSDMGNETSGTITVYDRIGKLVDQVSFQKEIRQESISFRPRSGLAAGLYHVHLTFGNQNRILKLVWMP
jgi:serine protease AprX